MYFELGWCVIAMAVRTREKETALFLLPLLLRKRWSCLRHKLLCASSICLKYFPFRMIWLSWPCSAWKWNQLETPYLISWAIRKLSYLLSARPGRGKRSPSPSTGSWIRKPKWQKSSSSTSADGVLLTMSPAVWGWKWLSTWIDLVLLLRKGGVTCMLLY